MHISNTPSMLALNSLPSRDETVPIYPTPNFPEKDEYKNKQLAARAAQDMWAHLNREFAKGDSASYSLSYEEARFFDQNNILINGQTFKDFSKTNNGTLNREQIFSFMIALQNFEPNGDSWYPDKG